MTATVLDRPQETRVEIPLLLRVCFWISVAGTVFDGWFSYKAVIDWEIGREANPILNSFTASLMESGMSHAQAFGYIMIWRVLVGVAMLLGLYFTAFLRLKKGNRNWITMGALPFTSVVFVLLTCYHVFLGYMRSF